MNDPTLLQAFWDACRAALSAANLSADPPAADHFCDNEPCANELGDLVRQSIKTAICGLLWSYEAEGEPLPQPGDLSIVTDNVRRSGASQPKICCSSASASGCYTPCLTPSAEYDRSPFETGGGAALNWARNICDKGVKS